MFLLEPILATALALTPGWTQERLVSALGEAGGSFALSHTDGEGLVASTTLNDCAVTFAGLRPSAPPVRELRETLVAGPRQSGHRYVAVLDRRGCGGKTIDLVDLDATGKVLRRKPLPVRGRPWPPWGRERRFHPAARISPPSPAWHGRVRVPLFGQVTGTGTREERLWLLRAAPRPNDQVRT